MGISSNEVKRGCIRLKSTLSIGTKLASWFLVFSVIPLLGVSFLAYKNGQESLKQVIEHELADSAFQMMDKIDRLLFFTQEDIRSWSADGVMKSVADGDANGSISAFLSIQKQIYGIYSALHCITPSGKIIASSNQDRIGLNVSRERWFENIIKHKTITFGDLRYDPLEYSYSLKISAPHS